MTEDNPSVGQTSGRRLRPRQVCGCPAIATLRRPARRVQSVLSRRRRSPTRRTIILVLSLPSAPMTAPDADETAPTIGLRLDGDEVAPETFLLATQSLLDILSEVRRSLSRSGAIAWRVSDLRRGSATIAFQPKSGSAQQPHTVATIARTVSGLQTLGTEPSRPTHFTDRALGATRKLAARTDVAKSGLLVFSDGLGLRPQQVQITKQITANIERLARPSWRSTGSVRGTLEMLTIRGVSKFAVYEAATGERIECRCTPDIVLSATRFFGKRVLVRGEIARAENGKRSITVQSLRSLAAESPPRLTDLRGLLSDDPVDIEEWARYMREE